MFTVGICGDVIAKALRFELFHKRSIRANICCADTPVPAAVAIQPALDIGSLMGAMEGTETEVNDSDPD